MAVQMRTLASAEDLRDHLDALNDAGEGFRAAGIDSVGNPFLITLVGPYAEAEHVFCYSPWDEEIEYKEDEPCDECGAHSPFPIGYLRYPVEVVVRA